MKDRVVRAFLIEEQKIVKKVHHTLSRPLPNSMLTTTIGPQGVRQEELSGRCYINGNKKRFFSVQWAIWVVLWSHFRDLGLVNVLHCITHFKATEKGAPTTCDIHIAIQSGVFIVEKWAESVY